MLSVPGRLLMFIVRGRGFLHCKVVGRALNGSMVCVCQHVGGFRWFGGRVAGVTGTTEVSCAVEPSRGASIVQYLQ